jgi:hypothetical protein
VLCLATTPDPYAGYCALLDRIASLAVSQSQTSTVALELLERVAEGRTASVGAVAEAQVGLAPGELQQKGFDIPPLRACALRKIGETALPGAVDFLAKLKPADFATDTTGQLWPAAQVALQTAFLNRIADLQLKIEFLEKALTELQGRASDGAVAGWAVNELCDHAAIGAIPKIQQSIRKRLSGQSGEDEIEFCEARMHVLSRDPDRVRALGSALGVDSAAENARVTWWAIDQLASMHSPNADAELDRFADEIEELPAGSPKREHLSMFEQAVQEVQRARAR